MQLKLTRGVLIGDTWHEAGEVLELPGRLAERMTRAGSAVPVESAALAPKAERAVAPRQAK